MNDRRPEPVMKLSLVHRRYRWDGRSGTTITEMVMVLFLIGVFAAGTALSTVGNRAAMREDQVVTGLLGGIRQCRQEAVTRNQPVSWWITNGYLAWWCDTNEDGLQNAEETETVLLDEIAEYSSYPQQGRFDSRGIHSTNHSTFNGMMVWIQLEEGTHLVTVSANGHAGRYQY